MERPPVQGSMRAWGGGGVRVDRWGSGRRGCYGEAGHRGSKLSLGDTEDF